MGDSTVVPAWYTGPRAGSPSLQPAVALLAMVTTQDTEPDPAGVGVRIAERMAEGRGISTVDPAMRHGRKTTGTKVDGYQSYQLTQRVPPATGARLITAVAVTPANAADGAPLPDLVVERAALTGATPAQVMGDTAYGATTVQTAVAPDTTVVAPVPPATNKAGRFPKGRFALDLAAETITCPQGATAHGTLRPRADGVRVARWTTATCAACPLRAQCGGEPQPGQRPPGPRSVSVRPDEARLRVRRAEQATPAWPVHYRTRRHVEHAPAQQSRHGGRQGRYWGRRKNWGQARLVATMYNLLELARAAALPGPPQPPWVTYA